MVVGAGIAGVQAALDLANSGFYVHLVEKKSAIGGVMAQLDKTFPTNDCSMCIMSPKLVECGRHLNIEMHTLSEVKGIAGEPGNFQVTVEQRPRFIDSAKCIACGICAQKCPKKVPDEFNQGLGDRKSAYVLYPQAVPLKYAIDQDTCIYFKKSGKCKACEKFCPAGAVDFSQKGQVRKVNVGAVILASGFSPYDPKQYHGYQYATMPNVVTSLEFERILSASGPFQGHLVRPSDHQEPKKIAWLQCVGSRDLNHCDNSYCSAVCCMYAIKQAVIAKEHSKEPLDAAIFFMDMRTHGKDFEKYYWRAEQDHGVRFLRSRVHSIDPVPDTSDVAIRYLSESGELKVEHFDMLVLSVGLEASKESLELAQTLGVEVKPATRFVETSAFTPVSTNKAGVYVCGAFQAPKDIPQSVMEASAAAAAAGELLNAARGTAVKVRKLPPETDVTGQEPRVGVFVCNCGINIGGIINVPVLTEFVATLPGVVFADQNLFSCSADTQSKILAAIKENKLNRVVVASCSPRTHAPLFMETMQEAGLNPYLFDMANIRDQDSWVHMNEPEKALEKAKDLVQMAVARVTLLEPLEKMTFPVTKAALVVGGGVAGMESALSIADMGFKSYLVEKGDKLGGQARNLVVSSRVMITRAIWITWSKRWKITPMSRSCSTPASRIPEGSSAISSRRWRPRKANGSSNMG